MSGAVTRALTPYWWRSSILGDIDRHCLAVIHPQFEGMVDRRIFGAGTVAHDIYSRVQQATNDADKELSQLDVEEIGRAAIKTGAGSGREFEHEPEPPLRPGAYLDGKDLAMRWLAERPAQPGRHTEIGITMGRWGTVVDKDSPKRWMRAILDLLYVDEDRILVIPDLKTDWPSEENALHSAQRRIQMMTGLSWATANGIQISGIRPEIWNLRRMKRYPREEERGQFTLTTETMGVLDEWREDLLALTDGYEKALSKVDQHPARLASPGAGCLAGEGGCPALSKCVAGQAWVAKRLNITEPKPATGGDPFFVAISPTDPPFEVSTKVIEAAVVQQPVLWAESGRLRSLLEPAADSLGMIEAGGLEAGWQDRPGSEPRKDALLELWREFRGEQVGQITICACRDYTGDGQPDEQCLVCKGLGKEVDWELELNRQRSLLVTFLRSVPIGSNTFTKKILPKLWPLQKVPKEDRDANKITRGLVSDRLLEPINRRKWVVRKARRQKPGESLVEQLEKSIEMEKEKKRFKEKP